MATMRAREPQRFLQGGFPARVPLVTVRAGENLTMRIGALDRQSGVVEVVARCRSRENHDLSSVGRWTAERYAPPPADHYYPVVVPIPAHSPSVTWEVHQILLCDGEGNRRTYHAGRDFEEMLFCVQGREGVDCTPPRLLGIQFGRA
jgi:hypothetical protein